MTKIVLLSVTVGIAAGYYILPESFIAVSGEILMAGLCILLFFVGLDIGIAGTAAENFKKAGWNVILFPISAALGTFTGAILISFFLPMTALESLMVGSGFGWYSLAPIILADYSAKISAISFMHNVFRELLGILAIPFVAKYIGYIETTGLPGAAAMDVCLPVVEKSTNADIAIISFISGVILSTAVPILVPFFASLA